MDNYEEFYCGECNYCVEMFTRRKDNTNLWCSLHNKRANYYDSGCQDFVLYEEGDEDE